MNSIQDIADNRLVSLLQELKELESKDVATFVESLDTKKRLELSVLFYQVSERLAQTSFALNESGGSLLGIAPDFAGLLSLIHAIDPNKLNANAIDILAEDFIRVLPSCAMLPKALSEVIHERMHEIGMFDEDE